MKKKINYIFLAIVLLFLTECTGYEPIFSSSNVNFEIKNYTVKGNETLGKRIYSKLYSLSKSNNEKQNVRDISLFIDVSKKREVASKNSAGKILEYKIILNAEIKVLDNINNEDLLVENFNYSEIYKLQSQYSETLKMENKAIENMISKIYQNLSINITKTLK
jgi:outer membrane lipopolysaccharide assembly protein LptE/RlpB